MRAKTRARARFALSVPFAMNLRISRNSSYTRRFLWGDL
jgi:hypothetical protein